MSSSFHTLEEGMKITLDLMLLQEPFAFPTSCSLQPLRLRGGRSEPATARRDPAPRPRCQRWGAAGCPASSSLRGCGAWGRCAPAQAVRLSRGHASARWLPAPPSDARGNGISTWQSAPKARNAGSQRTRLIPLFLPRKKKLPHDFSPCEGKQPAPLGVATAAAPHSKGFFCARRDAAELPNAAGLPRQPPAKRPAANLAASEGSLSASGNNCLAPCPRL